MSNDRVWADPDALEAYSQEVGATLPELEAAAEAYRAALVTFDSAEPNDLGGPALADLGGAVSEHVTNLRFLDAVPGNFASAFRLADRFGPPLGASRDEWLDALTQAHQGTSATLDEEIVARAHEYVTDPNRSLWDEQFLTSSLWEDLALVTLAGQAVDKHLFRNFPQYGSRLGRAAVRRAPIVSYGFAAADQWAGDARDPDLSTGDRLARAGSAGFLRGTGSTFVGGALGAVGAGAGAPAGPGAAFALGAGGTIVGGMLGDGAGRLLFGLVEDNVVAWTGSSIDWAIDVGESAIDGFGDLLDSAGG